MLDYLNPQSTAFQNALGIKLQLGYAPVGKIDLMLGYAMPNGAMVGIGGYAAFQTEADSLYGGTLNSNLI